MAFTAIAPNPRKYSTASPRAACSGRHCTTCGGIIGLLPRAALEPVYLPHTHVPYRWGFVGVKQNCNEVLIPLWLRKNKPFLTCGIVSVIPARIYPSDSITDTELVTRAEFVSIAFNWLLQVWFAGRISPFS